MVTWGYIEDIHGALYQNVGLAWYQTSAMEIRAETCRILTRKRAVIMVTLDLRYALPWGLGLEENTGS